MGITLFIVFLFIVAIVLLTIGKVQPNPNDKDFTFSLRPWALVPFLLGLFIFFIAIIKVVAPGNVAVPVTFGDVGKPVKSGIHLVMPWTHLHSISTRTQEYTMSAANGEGAKSGDDSISVLGADAAAADIDATLLYHVNEADAGGLYKKIGGNFVGKIVRPTSRTCIRDAFASEAIVDAATDGRSRISAKIKKCIDDRFATRGIVLEDFQLRNVKLGTELQGAVDAKVAAQQQSQQKVFELQKAEADARIKTVEAKATADSQQILACGGQKTTTKDSDGKQVDVIVPNDPSHCNQAQLTDKFLQYSYIQALKSLVDSPNNSTVVLPFDEKLTPLLNMGK